MNSTFEIQAETAELLAGLVASSEQLNAIYKASSDRDSTFRLLHLCSESTDEALTCEIENARLDDKLLFDAISYTWGESTDMKTICLNGEDVKIRTHLWQMLHRLRQRQWSSPLWVDVLCIRQDSIQDKNEQVAKIGHIFASAENVLAWVGLDACDSLPLNTMLDTFNTIREKQPEVWVQFMDTVIEGTDQPGKQMFDAATRKTILEDSGFTVDRSTPQYKKLLDDIQRSRPDLIGIDAEIANVADLQILRYKFSEALTKFMGRDYFYRTWIRQELILAKRVWLFCGDLILSEATFWPGAQFVVEFVTRDTEDIITSVDLEMDGFWVQQKLRGYLLDHAVIKCQKHREARNQCLLEGKTWGIDLKTLLELSELTRCLDPRDKFYALRSLLHPGNGLSVNVDYDLATIDLFEKIIPVCPMVGNMLDGEAVAALARTLKVKSTTMLDRAAFYVQHERQSDPAFVHPPAPMRWTAQAQLKFLGSVTGVVMRDAYANRSIVKQRRYQRASIQRHSFGTYSGSPDIYTIDAARDVEVGDLLWQSEVGGVHFITHMAAMRTNEIDSGASDDDAIVCRRQIIYGTTSFPNEEPHEGQHIDCTSCAREVLRISAHVLLERLKIQFTGDLPLQSAYEPLLATTQTHPSSMHKDEDDSQDGDDEHDSYGDDGLGDGWDYDEDDQDQTESQQSPEHSAFTEPVGILHLNYESFAALYAYGNYYFEQYL